MARSDRPDRSPGSAGLLSRGHRDGPQAGAAQPVGFGRSQPSHRAPEDKLIPAKRWKRDRARLIRDLNLPTSAEKYLQRLEAGLAAGLAALAEAAEAGAVTIEGGELRLPRRKPTPKDPRVEPTRQALARAVGDVQLPDLLIEIDGLTRFSWILLGRPARSEQELVEPPSNWWTPLLSSDEEQGGV